MKKVLLIALALITCLAAEAQLRTIKPAEIRRISDEDLYDLYIHDLDYVDKVVASSALKAQGSKNYKASNIFDMDPETAWVEGVKGHGIGQWIEFKDVSVRQDGIWCEVCTISILNGYVKSDKAWRENGRVKRLKVYCNGKPKCILELQNSRSMQHFNVYGLFSKRATIKFEILDVYPGTKYQDTAISEIDFNVG